MQLLEGCRPPGPSAYLSEAGGPSAPSCHENLAAGNIDLWGYIQLVKTIYQRFTHNLSIVLMKTVVEK